MYPWQCGLELSFPAFPTIPANQALEKCHTALPQLLIPRPAESQALIGSNNSATWRRNGFRPARDAIVAADERVGVPGILVGSRLIARPCLFGSGTTLFFQLASCWDISKASNKQTSSATWAYCKTYGLNSPVFVLETRLVLYL